MIPRLGAITWPDKRKWGYEGREYERVSVGKRSTALWEIRLASLPARKFNIRIDVRAGWREPVSFHSRLSGLCHSFLTPFILVIFHCMCIYRRIYRVSIYIYIYIGNSLRFLKTNRKMSVEVYLRTLHGIRFKLWGKLWRIVSRRYLLWWKKDLFISKWSFLIRRE